ncbi:Nucleoporin NUP57 [Pleurostoma richardsiae]|uniref:Nucleoporin NUP57 n=1 Tax=Pleurostoma richardsiae TaxID=41990 RepID=A0AA38RQD8_9PEZI|nr:Nucleoporin NUP57 [Pleurostoma richardsiae]
MSLFASLNKPAPAGQSLFGGSTATPSPFGQSTATANQPGQSLGIFGSAASNVNPAPQQQQQLQLQQQQQAQQPQQAAAPTLGQSQLNPLGSSLWQPGSYTPHQKSIPEQIKLITDKWDPANPNCAFKHYFYNKVDESRIPFYQPSPNEDPKEWEEALQAKPAPGFMPVLAAGFAAVAERLKAQRRAVGEFNARLHEINASLDAILGRHDLETSVRALAARRRHDLLRRRCLVLARKVQVLRNRGYSLSGDEDDLRARLEGAEKGLQDPALNARMEELWGRLVMLREYAGALQAEVNKRGLGEGDGLGEEVEAKAKKIIEDYEKQLQHLKKEVEAIKKEFEEWEKEHSPKPTGSSR